MTRKLKHVAIRNEMERLKTRDLTSRDLTITRHQTVGVDIARLV